MNAQLTEKNLRSAARKAGLKLVTGRRGDGPQKGCWVIDPDIKCIVFGGAPNGRGGSLEECAAYLQLSATERWLRVQEVFDWTQQSRFLN
jgi:hypothetical protein